ncbi:MAG: Crp/Fnr family transcriptional regulator [Eubacteriales bacterium]|nr:Crp/Fnr family transcriptional regulator [Eubacteriales bacterium]
MTIEELNHFLERQPFWPHLAPKWQDELLRQVRQVRYESGRPVISETSDCLGMLFILSGTLRIYLQAQDGRQITIYRLHGGEPCVLAASCALSAITFDVLIDAETDCELLLLPSAFFARLMKENIYVEAFAYRLTTEHFSNVMGAMERIFFMTLEQRVAAFLIDESAELGSALVPFTQEKLAMAIGSAREAVSRTLNQLAREGCVSLSRGCIRILDKNRLYGKLSL